MGTLKLNLLITILVVALGNEQVYMDYYQQCSDNEKERVTIRTDTSQLLLHITHNNHFLDSLVPMNKMDTSIWELELEIPKQCELLYILYYFKDGKLYKSLNGIQKYISQMEIQIMTFNIRYDNPKDGVNQWAYRKPETAAVMKLYESDFIGTQEVLINQVQYLDNELTNYSYFGRGRGKKYWDDEGCPIFYLTKKWIILEEQVFWLSDTPDVPGSKSYGNNLPRVCTYIKFKNATYQTYVINVYNCHLDHESEISRQKSASQIKKHMKDNINENEPIILMGDFNVPPDSPTLKIFETELFELKQTMKEADKDYATFHNWTGIIKDREEHIDFSLFNKGETMSYNIIYDNNGGFYPSDHYPVLSVIKL